jgi:hypothetical protein
MHHQVKVNQLVKRGSNPWLLVNISHDEHPKSNLQNPNIRVNDCYRDHRFSHHESYCLTKVEPVIRWWLSWDSICSVLHSLITIQHWNWVVRIHLRIWQSTCKDVV